MNNAQKNNIILNNPILVGGLGFISILTCTNTLKSALLMGLAVSLVLLLSSILVSLLRNTIDKSLEDFVLMIVIVGFSTVAQMLLEFYYPVSVQNMGIGILLISANSLLLKTLKDYAIKNSVVNSIKISIFTSLGYVLIMSIMGLIRELLSQGSIYGFNIIPKEYVIPTFSDAVFGFILLGIFIAISNKMVERKGLKETKKWI